MAVMMKEPEISEHFDLDDIRKIRAYNAARYEHMTPAEIVADTKAERQWRLFSTDRSGT